MQNKPSALFIAANSYVEAHRLMEAAMKDGINVHGALGALIASEDTLKELVWLYMNETMSEATKLFNDERGHAGFIDTHVVGETHATRIPIEPVPADDSWRQAMDEALVVRGIGVANVGDDAKEKLKFIIDWEVEVALDPRVSEKARMLVASHGGTLSQEEMGVGNG